MEANGVRGVSAPEGIDLWRMGRWVLPRLWQIALVAVITGIIGIIWALTIEPEFRGNSLIMISQPATGLSPASELKQALGGGAAELLGGGDQTMPDIKRMLSRRLARETVHQLGLEIEVKDPRNTFWNRSLDRVGSKLGMQAAALSQTAPVRFSGVEYPARLANHSVLLKVTGNDGYELLDTEGLFGKKGASILNGAIGQPAEHEGLKLTVASLDAPTGLVFELKLRREVDWLEDFRNRLSVAAERKADNLVNVGFTHMYRDVIEDVLNLVVEDYSQTLMSERSLSQTQRLTYINEEITARQSDLDEKQTAYYDFRENNKTIEITTQAKILLDQIAEYDAKVNSTELTKQAMSDLLDSLESDQEDHYMASPHLPAHTDVLLAEMVPLLAGLKAQRKALLADYTEKHAKVVALDNQIDQTRESIRQHLGSSISQLDENLSDYHGLRSKYLKQAENLPGTEQELLDKQREYEAALTLMTYLDQQKVDAELMLSSITPSFTFIEEAEVGLKPFKPRLTLSAASGVLLGLVIALMAFFFRFLARSEVFDELDAGEGARLLASLTLNNRQDELPLLIDSLIGNGDQTAGAGILLSCTPGCDTAGLCRELHQTAVNLGRRTIALIDSGSPLALAMASPPPQAPTELSLADHDAVLKGLRTKEGRTWIESAVKELDLLIAGPPPTRGSALGQQLARIAGCVTLVAVRGATKRRDMLELVHKLRLSGIRVQGTILIDPGLCSLAGSTAASRPETKEAKADNG